MFIYLVIATFVGVFIYSRYSNFNKDTLLRYSTKMCHLYSYLYNKHRSENSTLSKEEIYIKIVELEENNEEHAYSISLETLDLIREQLQPGYDLTFREIVKFLIIRKIFETPEIKSLLDLDDSKLEAFLKCALLPENEKNKAGSILKKIGITPEEQYVFASKLNSLEQAVNSSVPKEY